MFTVAVCDNTTRCVAKVNDAENITSMIVDEVLIIENFYNKIAMFNVSLIIFNYN